MCCVWQGLTQPLLTVSVHIGAVELFSETRSILGTVRFLHKEKAHLASALIFIFSVSSAKSSQGVRGEALRLSSPLNPLALFCLHSQPCPFHQVCVAAVDSLLAESERLLALVALPFHSQLVEVVIR